MEEKMKNLLKAQCLIRLL